MINIPNLTKRELLSYFFSPLAYVIMTVFLLVIGFFFYAALSESSNSQVMKEVLGLMAFITLIISPMITMRLVAEEKKSGTIEMLMTAPVTDFEVICSKFLAALVFYVFLILPTLAYVVLLLVWGNPDIGSLLTGYLGLVLLAGVFLSIGLFVSTLSTNQIVAAVVTFVILILGWLLGYLSASFPSFLKEVAAYAGFIEHLFNFTKGLIDSRDIIYYLSLIVFFLFLSIRGLEIRRWK